MIGGSHERRVGLLAGHPTSERPSCQPKARADAILDIRVPKCEVSKSCYGTIK